MSEDLQSLLEKINREGVEKARAEATKILAEAQAKATALIKAATTEAEKAKQDAEKAAADSAARAAETIRQAARDTLLKVEAAITATLEKLLTQAVDRALADEKTAAELAATALKGLSGETEITAGAKLAAALKAQLAVQPNLVIVTDDTLGTGFTVKLDGGRIEHSFTGEVLAAELAKRLRPELAKLIH